MALPFSTEPFYGVFSDHRAAMWSLQWMFMALALAAMVLVLRPRPDRRMAASAILGSLCFPLRPAPRSTLVVPWLWCGIGAQAAFPLGVQPELGLIASAVSLALLVPAGRPLRTRTS